MGVPMPRYAAVPSEEDEDAGDTSLLGGMDEEHQAPAATADSSSSFALFTAFGYNVKKKLGQPDYFGFSDVTGRLTSASTRAGTTRTDDAADDTPKAAGCTISAGPREASGRGSWKRHAASSGARSFRAAKPMI